MKKRFILLFSVIILLLSACNTNEEKKQEKAASENEKDTITYESENGPVEVPADPQRVVVLSQFAGNLIKLGVNIVGADSWAKDNPRFEELKDAATVSDDNLEQIIELEPDLIIGLSSAKNIDKLKEIAPTVTFTYGKADYLQQHIEVGKLVNKEEEARKWVENFEQEATEVGKQIKDKIGEDATVSVVEKFDKQWYVFGDNWGRGTEILYQAMGLKMPETVKKHALKDGYYALSEEVIPDFAGDYLIVSDQSGAKDTSYLESDIFQSIPAVQNDNVFVIDGKKFYFNDASTLEYQLEFFKGKFLGE
ncbi:ABC transporter substrate-binding protein [Virgibacillus pantothenticus]|uniref:ABC transporter substrate-binding protein n=1 Tax=Virgibacillus pantothenticus TaxID=1473 RepID=A0A0L0QVS6_VIRPA|nr:MULTISPECIES: iron-hydroxamate ABC transporter substrate-binding protein [Virgibacillus]API92422.1 ABC transporter substrate-binding protein [Virgibacillus sp. 6R]KNE22627.1 ABC transporter substrate-binding protein [Virgibacillus pantothenticus]MBS7427331.1 iron-hydroxamate ABC transporter substrate-binding protein [Virgibacillus sp. 19R1-5]MED3736987.1 iron-hydroxamate ABC transporter substrate-binding protein [Virgibacillus pantothenticus]QTY16619.1 iron-hydroxamate ABC transporter subst